MKILFHILTVTVLLVLVPQYSPALALEITAVGDIYLSQRIIDQHANDLLNIKLSGDIVFANFEGVLSATHTRNDILMLRLTMPMDAVDVLRKIGVNTLSLANNDSLDLGLKHYENTFLKLKQSGFNIAGLDDDGKAIDIDHMKIRFIAFSFSGVNNVNDLERASKLIRSFKEEIIIISAHMGGESMKGYHIPSEMEFFGDEKRGDVREFAHTCIDAGADLILGHGPHILRGIELYRNKLIVYSLGNFIFDYPGVEKHGSTPAYSVSISMNRNGNFQMAKITNYTLQHGIPVLDKANRAFRHIKHLSLTGLKNDNLVFKGGGTIYPKGGNL